MSPDLDTSFVLLPCESQYLLAEELDTLQVVIFQRYHEKSCVVRNMRNSFLIKCTKYK